VLVSLLTVVHFYPEKKGMKDLVLNMFLQKFNQKHYSDRMKLKEVRTLQCLRVILVHFVFGNCYNSLMVFISSW